MSDEPIPSYENKQTFGVKSKIVSMPPEHQREQDEAGGDEGEGGGRVPRGRLLPCEDVAPGAGSRSVEQKY